MSREPEPEDTSGRCHRESWWMTVRAVLVIAEVVAVVRHHEALAEVARALIVAGDGIAGAGRH